MCPESPHEAHPPPYSPVSLPSCQPSNADTLIILDTASDAATKSDDEVDTCEINIKSVLKELVTMGKLSIPCVFSYLVSCLNRMLVAFMVGHLGPDELAASTLAVMFSNLCGFSICFGTSTALDTLASQAVTGAKNPRQAGIYLQRAILINFVLAIPISLLWIFSNPLLRLAGQEPHLAHLAGRYIQILLVGLIPNILTNNIAKFLQAQGFMKAQFLVTAAIFPINIAIQYFLVYHPSPLQMGFYGAPLGSVIADTMIAGGMVLYTAYVNGHQCWHPWSAKALKDWRQYLALGAPGCVMICCEWWMFEIVALVAGLFGAKILAAQSVLVNTSALLYMIYLGVSIVSANRVGNLLGAGRALSAKFTAYVSIMMAMFLSLVIASLLVALRTSLSYIFTDDLEVNALVSTVAPVVALFQLASGTCCVAGGVLRGCGRQSIGASINLATYYGVGLPLALTLAFVLDLKLAGLWLGLACAQVITLASQVLYIHFRINWVAQCRLARARVNSDNEKACH